MLLIFVNFFDCNISEPELSRILWERREIGDLLTKGAPLRTMKRQDGPWEEVRATMAILGLISLYIAKNFDIYQYGREILESI